VISWLYFAITEENTVFRFVEIRARFDQRDPRRIDTKVDQTVKRTVAINVATVKEYRLLIEIIEIIINVAK